MGLVDDIRVSRAINSFTARLDGDDPNATPSIERMRQVLGQVVTNLQTMQGQLQTLQTTIQGLNTRLAALESQNLPTRVAALEAKAGIAPPQ